MAMRAGGRKVTLPNDPDGLRKVAEELLAQANETEMEWAANEYANSIAIQVNPDEYMDVVDTNIYKAFIAGVKWSKANA